MATVDHIVNFYSIDQKTGKLALLQKFQADFSAENPSLNHVALSPESKLLATGGDDNTVRVFTISKDFKQHELKEEAKVAEGAI